jgi:hypothetical protein
MNITEKDFKFEFEFKAVITKILQLSDDGLMYVEYICPNCNRRTFDVGIKGNHTFLCPCGASISLNLL